jgi:hypothetical protein
VYRFSPDHTASRELGTAGAISSPGRHFDSGRNRRFACSNSLPYEVLAARIWQLRPNLTSYDAAYVALAAALGLPLLTLDQRIQRVPGVTCTVDTPPGSA